MKLFDIIKNFIKPQPEVNKLQQLFDEKIKTFRDFQLDAFNSSKTSDIGQIFLPTGTGKTLIQLAIHVDDMIKKNPGNYGVYVIAAHRLVLCNQLFQEFREFVSGFDLSASYIYVGSDQQGDETFEATTDPDKIKEIVDQSKDKKHVVIVATYNSFKQLSVLEKIDVCTYDEVHTSVRDDFRDNIASVKDRIAKNYFFTATKKELENGLGQNDEDFYGKILYDKMPPAKAIDQIEIVPPRIHQIKVDCKNESDDPIENNLSMLFKVIASSFTKHKKIIDETSHKKIGGKILVNTQGLHQVHPFQTHNEFKQWCISNNINVFSFSSNQGEHVNFLKVTRQKALETLQGLKDEDDAIIFHYNIISEGIDLPNLTGVIILRNVDRIKFTQIIGRACRLLKSDRSKLYSGYFINRNQLTKPRCWVIIPEYKGVDPDLLINLTKHLREAYEVPTETYKVLDKVSSEQSEANGKPRKLEIGVDDQELKHILETYSATIEDDLNKMFDEAEDKEQFLLDVLDEVEDDEEIERKRLLEGREAIYKEFLYFKRNPKLREECLKIYGYDCYVCKKNLESIYGKAAKYVVEIHHEKEFSIFKEEHEVDPKEDLKPVCPDCHTIIHKRKPCYTIEEIQNKIKAKIITHEKEKTKV